MFKKKIKFTLKVFNFVSKDAFVHVVLHHNGNVSNDSF